MKRSVDNDDGGGGGGEEQCDATTLDVHQNLCEHCQHCMYVCVYNSEYCFCRKCILTSLDSMACVVAMQRKCDGSRSGKRWFLHQIWYCDRDSQRHYSGQHCHLI